MMAIEEKLLEMEGIGKSFAGVRVLKDINLTVYKGEVRAVLGANGAGKSTLMKIIGGAYKPDSGRMLYRDKPLELQSPSDAQKKGISVIYQELSLVPTLDVISNIYLGREKTNGAGWLDEKKMLADYESLCNLLNFRIPPKIKVRRLGIAHQQMVEIMKAISRDSEVIIMDEPTTSLTENEKASLFKTVQTLKEKGKTILYITHMLDEVFKISDSITILKDGALEGTFTKDVIDKAGVISIMTGNKAIDITDRQEKPVSYEGEPVLELRGLNRKNVLKNISFKLYKGEILGIAGLVGSGRTELCNVLFGIDHLDCGEIFIEGRKVQINTCIDAISNGIGLIPEDRKNYGLIQIHEVFKNSTSVQIDKMLKAGFLSKNKESVYTQNAVERLGIKLKDIKTRVRNLSGGNQQKVVVSKWLDMDLKVMLFDEPTKGIDIAAKEDIFKIMVNFASKGFSIIFISSDLEEVARLSNRVIVMRAGMVVAELTGERVNINDMTYSALNG
jgi:ABC-type sugar transport system, ATPase component